MKQQLLGALSLSLAASIWGGMYVVSKYVLNDIPPLTLVWLRYMIAFFVLFLILKRAQRKHKVHEDLTKKQWFLIAWIGFIGYFVSIAFQFIGTKLSDAHTGALITSATPAFMILFARVFLHEKFSVQKAVALITATCGVLVVIGGKGHIGSYFWGSIILVGAALTWALMSVFVKMASKTLSTLTMTTHAVLFALLFTTPLMMLELHTTPITHVNFIIIIGILYLGIISTAGAFFLWNKGLELMDAGIGSLFFFFQPVVGTLLGWLILNEKLNVHFYLGGTLVLIGVIMATLQKKKGIDVHSENLKTR